MPIGGTRPRGPGVELYEGGRKRGVLQQFAWQRGEFGDDGAMGRVVSRGDALWLVAYRSLFKYDGASFQLIAPPSALGGITDGALDRDGSLWLCDRGKLLRRNEDGRYLESGGFRQPVREIEPAPDGGFLVLTEDELYRVEGSHP